MANRRIQNIPLTSRPDGGFRPLSRIDNINRSGSGDFSLHTFQAVQPRLSGQEVPNIPAERTMLNPQFQYEYDCLFDYETPVGQIIGGQHQQLRLPSQSDTPYNQLIAGAGSRPTSVGKGVISAPDVRPGLMNPALFHPEPCVSQHGPQSNNSCTFEDERTPGQLAVNEDQDERSGNDENNSSEDNNKPGTDEDDDDDLPSLDITAGAGSDHNTTDAVLDDVTGPLPTNLAQTHRRFQIKFNVWRKIAIPNSKNKSKQKSKKCGQGSKSARSTYQWKQYRPTCDVKKILRLSSFGWPVFRRKLLECCESAKEGISKDLLAADRRGNLTIMGWIHGSANHKKNDEQVLKDSAAYKLFMEAARRAPANTKMGFKIIHPNPKDTCQSSTEEEEDEPSALEKEDQSNQESEDEDPIDVKLQILMKKFSKSFKAGENVAVFPNPKNAGEVMVLTARRLRQWAGDWAHGKRGADDVNPPSNRGWRFVPVSEYEKERLRMIQMEAGSDEDSVNQPNPTPATNVSPSPGININLFGAGPFPFGNNPFLTPMGPGINGTITSHNTSGSNATPFGPGTLAQSSPTNAFGPGALIESTPTNPSYPNSEIQPLSPAARPYPEFEEFLGFAKIRPQMTQVRDALEREGITDFERLLDREMYTVDRLRSFGIPFAQAADIWKAVPKFNEWVKNH